MSEKYTVICPENEFPGIKLYVDKFICPTTIHEVVVVNDKLIET
jgi:hypothetical protein